MNPSYSNNDLNPTKNMNNTNGGSSNGNEGNRNMSSYASYLPEWFVEKNNVCVIINNVFFVKCFIGVHHRTQAL